MVAGRRNQGGVTLTPQGADFTLWSPDATQIDLCLYDATGTEETGRLGMIRGEDGLFCLFVPGVAAGTRYGYRASGTYAPDQGLWFDPSKLLVDPYATELDRPFHYEPTLGHYGVDSGSLVPKAVVTVDRPVTPQAPVFCAGGFVYEISVRAFTMLHPEIPAEQRGTVAALAHPAIITHLQKLGVDAVELMPITAWIDERHLGPLGLTNSWGYNPVAFMALDPRLVPGGMTELRETVEALRAAGIGTILDLVFNHTGESDRDGATLSLRGLSNLASYRHIPGRPGDLVNDTGCGNTVAGDHPYIRQLIVDSLRHFVINAGVDGFRFDLAPIMLRTPNGFDRDCDTAKALVDDDILGDRILIAEPWDIGPGGYQLGNFPEAFLEWNDRTRDDIRRVWRGDRGMRGALATAIAGSSGVFGQRGATQTRTVNFIAAHDGFTLMDLVSNTHKHNEANGEDNRDGHNENYSWNNGAEGMSEDIGVIAARRRDIKGLLGTLFASRGTVMITAGDEGGRSQRGNNNAYCQDNAIGWLDWASLDPALVNHTAFLARLRKRFSALAQTAFFTGQDGDILWVSETGGDMTVADWENADSSTLCFILKTRDLEQNTSTRLAVAINAGHQPCQFALQATSGTRWQQLDPSSSGDATAIPARSVIFFSEMQAG